MENEILNIADALWAYVRAAGRMRDRWSEGDQKVKDQLWKDLHSLEDKARGLLESATAPPAAGEKMREALEINPWVSVDDKMPEHNLGVLVFIPSEDDHITSGMWDIDNKWVLLDEYRTVGEGEGMEDCRVTHWMKMPFKPNY